MTDYLELKQPKILLLQKSVCKIDCLNTIVTMFIENNLSYTVLITLVKWTYLFLVKIQEKNTFDKLNKALENCIKAFTNIIFSTDFHMFYEATLIQSYDELILPLLQTERGKVTNHIIFSFKKYSAIPRQIEQSFPEKKKTVHTTLESLGFIPSVLVQLVGSYFGEIVDQQDVFEESRAIFENLALKIRTTFDIIYYLNNL